MHPEVEELISKRKQKWRPELIAMFEDIKEAFPNKSLDWGLHVLIKYIQPETILRDADRGVEVWMEMDVVRKIAPIAEKYGFVRPEQRTALAMIATEVAVKNEMREEMRARDEKMKDVLKMLKEQGPEIKEMLKTLISDVRDVQPAQTAPRTPRKKGRPSKQFEDFLLPNAPEGLMPVLEEMLEGKTGKAAFSIILAITDIYIDEPETKSVCRRFPSIKESSYEDAKSRHYGINRYHDKATPIENYKLVSIRNKIREKLNLESKNSPE